MGRAESSRASLEGASGNLHYREAGRLRLCRQRWGPLLLPSTVFSPTTVSQGRSAVSFTAPIQLPGLTLDPQWFRRSVFYEVMIRSFLDSNGDGAGDLAGLVSKLD